MMWLRRGACVLCLLASAFAATAARGEQAVVLPESSSDGADGALFEELAVAITEPGRQVIGPGRTLDRLYGDGPVSRLRAAQLRQLVELVERGETELRQLRLSAALFSLSQAAGLSRAVGPYVSDGNLLPRVHFLTGVVLERKNEPALSEAAFRRAASLHLEFAPSVETYPPEILSSFARAREAVRSGKRCPLRVESAPGGGAVRLDGRPQGSAPLQLSMTPGEHYLFVEATSYAPAGQTVEACSASRIVIQLLPKPVLPPPSKLTVAVHLDAVRAALEASSLVLVRRTREGIWFKACRGESPSTPAACSTGVIRLVAGGAIDAQPIRSALMPRPRISRRWYQSWWFWTGVGIAATTALAVSLPLTLRSSDSRYLVGSAAIP